MSRISSNVSMLASDDRSSSSREGDGAGEQNFEALLAEVVEKQEYVPPKKRNRRKLRPRRQTLTSSDPILRFKPKENEVVSVYSDPVDGVRVADTALVLTVHQKKSAQKPYPVPISFRPHTPSRHVLRLQGMAQSIDSVIREPVERTVHAWVMPYETPPSLKRLAAEAADLYIDFVDPQHYFEQFTPADPSIAFQEAFGWWARIRAPFIRWEVQRLSTHSTPSVPEEEWHLIEQFTPAVSTDHVSSLFSFKQRFLRAFQGFTDGVEERIESIKDREDELITETEQAWGVPVLVPRIDTIKILAGFVVLLFVASLPAGAVSLSRSFRSDVNQTVQKSQAALEATRQAFQNGQPSREALAEATKQFQSAEESLRHANALVLGLAHTIPQARQTYRGSQALLRAGEKSMRATQMLSEGVKRAWSISVHHPDERLQALALYLDEAAPLIHEARKEAESVEVEALPETFRPHIGEVKIALAQGEDSLRDLRALLDLGMLVLGHDEPRTYLFVFQNPSELRPSGGFMGSMTEVVFDRGMMKKMRTPGGGPYDLRNQLSARVRGPAPLQLLKDHWEFQDANWFPDFSLTAQKIRWFWSKSGQPTLDGVIAINAPLLERLLRVTGPMEISGFGKTVTADNVLSELQKSVELEYDKSENQPKKIIGAFMPSVLEKMREASQEDALQYLNLFAEALETKDIQIWMARPQEQNQMESFRWAGRIASVPGDALAVIEANIGGQKTDAVIKEDVLHEVEIQENGSMIGRVTLQREHKGVKGELFRGANNVAFVRFYVPRGSELLSASGFMPPSDALFDPPLPTDTQDADLASWVTNDVTSHGLSVTDESGRTSFGGWIQLEPGHSSTTIIRYKLPMTVQEIAQKIPRSDEGASSSNAAAYLLSLTSQSGKPNRQIETRVRFPEAWGVKWSSPGWEQEGAWMKRSSTAWNRDHAHGLLFDFSHVQISQDKLREF